MFGVIQQRLLAGKSKLKSLKKGHESMPLIGESPWKRNQPEQKRIDHLTRMHHERTGTTQKTIERSRRFGRF